MFEVWAYGVNGIQSISDEEIAARLAPEYMDWTIYFFAELSVSQ